MDEAGIRALLRARVEWGIAPGKRVVPQDAVAEAGDNVDAVGRFLVARGGERVEPARRGRLAPVEPSARPHWLVPSELLAKQPQQLLVAPLDASTRLMSDALVTAPALARRVGADPKRFRDWLRAEWRDGHELLRGHVHNGRWYFTETEALQLQREYLEPKQPNA